MKVKHFKNMSLNNIANGSSQLFLFQVQTVTRRELERRLRRQVVLADGRVIEEGVPEVTVDAVEDEQTHEDGGGGARRRRRRRRKRKRQCRRQIFIFLSYVVPTLIQRFGRGGRGALSEKSFNQGRQAEVIHFSGSQKLGKKNLVKKALLFYTCTTRYYKTCRIS